ncbi:TauD/TfdA dioxygenase family protein [Pseudomonas aeruginosa]|nr:TauD/TfdA family dioxygenase [Pseudomonas aeruginosa]UTN35971.1 TauD/TfdA family dioxygenase [Pseudomonas aeruginosa]
MRIEQITYNIGAELLDVSLRDAAYDDGLFNEVYAALLKHRVLFLRDQDISQKDHVAFAARMGELEDHPVLPTPDAAPGLVQIYKTPDKPVPRYENVWHTDNSWRSTPSKACVLRCVECPPVGGDTMWANMVAAYENLPNEVKAQIEDLRASHSFLVTMQDLIPEDQHEAIRAKWPAAEHPVVRTHPETGEKILYIGGWSTHFVNYHKPSRVRFGQDHIRGGSDLYQYLVSQASIPEYQVRWRWKKNSVAIWDNRSTQHYAVMDYPPCHRKMERASIAGCKSY